MREVSVWAYPWDLHDLGVDTVVATLAGVGVGMVSLATSYHAGRFLQPGNPKRRVYFPEDGTVYYKVDPVRWAGAEIVPLEARIVAEEGDQLAALVDLRDRGGPGVSCWTVCLHNTRLGMLHPEHVVRTAHGDPHYYGLCPSSPAARAYVTGMVREISERYRPDRIELESPDFMGFSHGYHHEKDGLPVLREDDFLLGVCFCDHCLTRATMAGVDATGARAMVLKWLDAALARELPEAQFPDFPALGIAAFAGFPVVHDYLLWRSEPVTSLVAEIKAVVPEGVRLLLIDFEGSWSGGVDVAAVVPFVDGIVHCAYFTPVERIASVMAGARAVLGPEKTLTAGFQLFHPNVKDRDDLAARVKAAGGVDGFNFYNLGLVPPKRLEWIGAALAG
ncbi:MAG: hypothetical protein NTX73_04745 [Rhodobacterales bacterium]|nr:hypothetical protein [Rhodobacterales bacterium]